MVPSDLPGVMARCEFRLQQPLDGRDLLIIATQDCDLCSPIAEEPQVELMIARPAEEDANLRYGKSARRLQVDLDGATYTIDIRERCFLPKDVLGEATADTVLRLSVSDTKVYRRWLGRRYSRTPLPSEFNRRCSAAANKLRNKLKKKSGMIRRIFLQLSSFEELEAVEPYRLSVVMVVTGTTLPGTREHEDALAVQTALETAFASCEGIELDDVLIVSEDELTVGEADVLTPWEYPDSISFREGTPEQLLTEP